MTKYIIIMLVALLIHTVIFATGNKADLKKSSANLRAPNREAPQGGNFWINYTAEPTTINPISSTDVYASRVHAYTMDTLLTQDRETFEWSGALANKWEISKDKKVFTFTLRDNIFFHDGKPVTTQDVKFSYDVIFDDKYESVRWRPYFESVSKVEVVDAKTIRFTVKDTYFQNFDFIAGGLKISPKHIYGDPEKSKKMNREIIGAGPYKLEKYDKGQRLVLKKFDKWYGKEDPLNKGTNNFDTVSIRFASDENVYLEMLKKGDIDYNELTPEQYEVKTNNPAFEKTINRKKVQNSLGQGYRYLAFKLDHPIFKDLNVRKAMVHLMNREEMNQKFRYGLSLLATGPTDVTSDFAAPSVKPMLYNLKLAKELLTKAGWKDEDKNGVLEKTIDGKKTEFKFSLMYANKTFEKYFTFYQEDLKKAGIQMDLKVLEWNSFIKNVDERNFEAISMAWTTQVEFDAKQIWHSSSTAKGGSNYIGYKNAQADKLIDEARLEMDRKKRIPKLRKVYELIANDVPYIFMFNEKYSMYGLNKRIGQPHDTFKYSIGSDTWWVQP
jgi:microcin C transport system substrate-binding protein